MPEQQERNSTIDLFWLVSLCSSLCTHDEEKTAETSLAAVTNRLGSERLIRVFGCVFCFLSWAKPENIQLKPIVFIAFFVLMMFAGSDVIL